MRSKRSSRGMARPAARVRWEGTRSGFVEGRNGSTVPFCALKAGGFIWVWLGGRTFKVEEETAPAEGGAGPGGRGEPRTSPTAPIPGRVERVAVKAGDRVEAGSLLLTISAMKMEHEVRATRPGEVREVRVKEGDRVEAGDLLVRIEPAP